MTYHDPQSIQPGHSAHTARPTSVAGAQRSRSASPRTMGAQGAVVANSRPKESVIFLGFDTDFGP